MLNNSNRIVAAVSRMEKQVAKRIEDKLTTPEKLVEVHKTLDIEFDEFAKFQELKSLACADGRLSVEEAQTIYNYLGTTPSTFNRQAVHVKAVLTQLFQELLNQQIEGK